MGKYCIRCRKHADFVIQWGPNADQKEYVCSHHLADAVEAIKAIEFFVVKIGKIS
tara:strand:+ start:332 stop:496 length:165 start_codon:yes stop_codon:yes gene_type:complete